jgi:hypothetical protein
MVGFTCSAQTHLEYISEPSDSMAVINKEDIDLINGVFNERNALDSLYNLNEQIISNLEVEINIQDSIIINQNQTIKNNEVVISELETRNNQNIEMYSKELKKEKRKKISFQSLTGVGIITIILLLLL